MATKKKMLHAAAGAAGGGGGLDVSEVFSTYLYDGTGSAQTITNNIDLSGEGGMVWFKVRTTTGSHALFDTERGTTKYVSSNYNDAEGTQSGGLTAFNTDGFTVGSWGEVNESGQDLASWTFRKAPKFFDVVTYTGDGTTGRQISHDLDHTVGCMIIKKRSASGYWGVYHRSTDSTAPEDYVLLLNSTSAKIDEQFFINDTAPTSTHFTVGAAAASGGDFNTNGATYVAYLFAHNDGDGEFGPDGDADIIKCGSYTGTGSSGNFVDLGFEPQFMLIKNTSSTANWIIHDNMRGMIESTGNVLFPNLSAAENTTAFRQARPNATGITFFDGNSETNGSGSNYIYIAIRRGPMAVPESATDVFSVSQANGGFGVTGGRQVITGFPVDFFATKETNTSGAWSSFNRLTNGERLQLNNTTPEQDYSAYVALDYMTSYNRSYSSSSNNMVDYAWRRAPNFFDAVAYTGNGTAGRTVSHNLGVAPEMMCIKSRNAILNWYVYHASLGNGYDVFLNLTNAQNNANTWNYTDPTSADFTLSGGRANVSGNTYVAYLFASLDGVSKVGSYTGNGSTQTINCGFSSGARFVLIKRTDSTGDWYVWDTERGIVAANDPHLSLNTTTAEVTTDDSIDPVSSGFAVNQVSATNINVSSASYIFYAVS